MSRTTQKVKQSTESCTKQQSATLVRNVLRSSISSIAYLRYIFPEENFMDAQLAGLKIKTLIPGSNPEITIISDWLENGVFDALEKHFLRALVFSIFAKFNDPTSLLESYTFKFSYPSENDVSLDVITNNGKEKTNLSLVTKDQIQQAWCTMIRTLITLSHTLPPLPNERHLSMKLFYYDDITPENYNPPGFKESTDLKEYEFVAESERIDIGNGVSTKYHTVSLRLDTAISNYQPKNFENSDNILNDILQGAIIAIFDSGIVNSKIIADGVGLPRNSKKIFDIINELELKGFILNENGNKMPNLTNENKEIYNKLISR